MTKNYLESIHKQFRYYKMLGDKTFAQLSDDQLFWRYTPESNSIAVIVSHIAGNMLSRWTDFLTSDGEKEWRNRDGEFEDQIKTRTQLVEKWEKGWTCLFDALNSIDESNFDTMIYIRNMGHTVVEAINRQLAHYSYHIGQITLIGVMLKGEEWKSLSVPKGQSKAYNAKQFAHPKRKAHFTDNFLDEESKR